MSILYYLSQVPKITTTGTGKQVDIPIVRADVLLNSGLNIAYFLAGLICIVVIIIAGYSFTTAVYDPAKITQAKNALLYAIVGLICVIFAFAVTQFVMGRFK
jgi:hypothetical protein